MSEIIIRSLTPTLLPEWLAFFDHAAFTDNHDWSSCYCHFYLADHTRRDWDSRSAEDNRAASSALITTGRMQGYLAFENGKAIGWCNAAPRLLIPNLNNDPDLAIDDAHQVGSIVCFIVAPANRGQGVAKQLLETACAGFQSLGLKIAEAYPRTDAVTAAANYHGPLSMYLATGFEVFDELNRIVVVRKTLTPT